MQNGKRRSCRGGSVASQAVQSLASPSSYALLSSALPQKGGNAFPAFRLYHNKQQGGSDLPQNAINTIQAMQNIASHNPMVRGSPAGLDTSYKLGGGAKRQGGANGGCFSPAELKKMQAESKALQKKLAKAKAKAETETKSKPKKKTLKKSVKK
jgi:hypothetical protein